MRWYLRKAQHPYRNKIIGHYWRFLSKPAFWVKYDADLLINLCLKDYIQSAIFFNGYYERTIVEWLSSELKPDDVFWDVGANIGAITLIAARHCASVVAFEPDPSTMAKLRRNVDVNRLKNVRLESTALSDCDGEVLLNLGPESNTGMNSIVASHPDRPCVPVKAVRADSILASTTSLNAPSVMKVDVEGAEAKVFAGALNLLSSPRLRAIMFEAKKGAGGRPDDQSLCLSLEAMGFRMREFGCSDEGAKDEVTNYLALRRG